MTVCFRQSSSSGAVDPSGQTTPAGGVDAYGRATDVNIAGQLKPGDYATDRPYATSSIYNTMMAGRQLTGKGGFKKLNDSLKRKFASKRRKVNI